MAGYGTVRTRERAGHEPGDAVAPLTHQFTDDERRGVYRAIYERRDVRSHFSPVPLPDEVLARILDAAHHAPSVGFMQPWEFIIVGDPRVRRSMVERFTDAHRRAASTYTGERRRLYKTLKLEAVLDSAVNVCVTCNPSLERGHGLGRQTMPETAVYSAVCAIQNCWLAARAEGVGVGWVSIVDPDALRDLLGIPAGIVPVGYLCLGYVTGFDDMPELETKGWERRVPLAEVIHFDRYGAVDPLRAQALAQRCHPVTTRGGR